MSTRGIADTILIAAAAVIMLFCGQSTAFSEDGDINKLARLEELRNENDKTAAKGLGSTELPGWKSDHNEIKERAGSMVEGLLLCIGFLLVGTYFFKRCFNSKCSGNSRRMQLIERLPVTGKTALLLVSIDGREVMVGVGSDNISTWQLPMVRSARAVGHLKEQVCESKKKRLA